MNNPWNLRQIQCFISLAKTLHFGQAALSLHMTQPALSRQIKKLEAATNLHLVDRNQQRVQLTQAGEEFLSGCLQAVQALETARNNAQLIVDGFAGKLKIGYTEFAIMDSLPGMLCSFKQQFPKIVQQTVQGDSSELIRQLFEKQIDIAFVTGPVQAEEFHHYTVTEHKLLAVLYSDHALASRNKISLNDLINERFILGDAAQWDHYLRHVNTIFEQQGKQPHIVETAYSSEGLFGLVAGKLGITIYPDCITTVSRPGLVLREIDDLQISVPTQVIWRKGDQSSLVKQFVDSITNQNR